MGGTSWKGAAVFGSSTCNAAGLTLPVAEDHGSGDCSVTGGYVYRGAGDGVKDDFYGDLQRRIWGLRRNGTVFETALLADTTLSISTFGEDEAGELYVADYATGDIYRIVSPEEKRHMRCGVTPHRSR